MRIFCLWMVMLVLLGLAGTHAVAQSNRQETLSLDERVWIASKLYASIQIYFGHWQGVPGLDLDEAYRDYLRQVAASDERLDFNLATRAFMARLKNGHSSFSDPWLVNTHGNSIGFQVREIDGQWVVVSTRIDAVNVGDVLEQIDGVPIDTFVTEKARYVAESSDWRRKLKVFWRAFLFPDAFTLTLDSGRTVEIVRSTQQLNPSTAHLFEQRMVGDSIPYVYIPSFGDSENERKAVDFVKEHADAEVLIIDVRGNDGGTSPVDLIRALMDRPYQDWTQSSGLSIGLFGAYAQIPNLVDTNQLGEYIKGFLDAFEGFERPYLMIPGTVNMPDNPIYTGRLLLLTDEGCVSACEDFLLPFKASGRAPILGRSTAGSTGQPFMYNFDNGMDLRVSSKRVFFPDGSTFEGVGIVPDFVVERSVEDLKNGRDAVLERAVEMARSADH